MKNRTIFDVQPTHTRRRICPNRTAEDRYNDVVRLNTIRSRTRRLGLLPTENNPEKNNRLRLIPKRVHSRTEKEFKRAGSGKNDRVPGNSIGVPTGDEYSSLSEAG